MVNKLMRLTLFALALLFPFAISQILVSKTKFEKSRSSCDIKQRVMEYVVQSYPQLSDYSLVDKSCFNRIKHNKDLQLLDFHFVFENSSNIYSVLATVSLFTPNQFLSISPLAINIQGSSSFISTGNYSSKTHNMTNELNSMLKGNELGGYQTFTNTTDTRLETAEAFVASLHPYLIDFWCEFVQYQIVQGVNFIIQYIGFDSITMVTANVDINLHLQPQLLSLEITCQTHHVSSLAILCTDELAQKVFNTNELLKVIHPQLLSFTLISMVSDDTDPSDGILFIITFQDRINSTRILTQINIEDNSFTIMSYYTYSYFR